MIPWSTKDPNRNKVLAIADLFSIVKCAPAVSRLPFFPSLSRRGSNKANIRIYRDRNCSSDVIYSYSIAGLCNDMRAVV